MSAAFLIGVAIIVVPNILLAITLWWIHVATDARLTLRGMRYVTFVFSVIAVGAFLSVWGFVGWLEVAP